MMHIDEPNEQEFRKDIRNNADRNKFKHKGIFGFVLFILKLHLSRTTRNITARGTISESLEYGLSSPRIIRHTPTNPTNRSICKYKRHKTD